MQRQHEAIELAAEVLVNKLVVVAAQDGFAFCEVATELAGFFPAAFTDTHVVALGAAQGETNAASGARLRVNRLNEVREAELTDLGWDRARGLTAFKRLER